MDCISCILAHIYFLYVSCTFPVYYYFPVLFSVYFRYSYIYFCIFPVYCIYCILAHQMKKKDIKGQTKVRTMFDWTFCIAYPGAATKAVSKLSLSEGVGVPVLALSDVNAASKTDTDSGLLHIIRLAGGKFKSNWSNKKKSKFLWFLDFLSGS